MLFLRSLRVVYWRPILTNLVPGPCSVISISISISNPCHNTKTNLSQHNDPILSKMVPGSCFVISIANFYKVLPSAPDWPVSYDSSPHPHPHHKSEHNVNRSQHSNFNNQLNHKVCTFNSLLVHKNKFSNDDVTWIDISDYMHDSWVVAVVTLTQSFVIKWV